VSTLTLLTLAQDLAASHYGTGGLSVPHLRAKGMTWVITRQHFEVSEYPLWLDEVILSTWAKPPKGPFCYRNFAYSWAPQGKKASLDAAQGGSPERIPQSPEPFFRGVTCWLVLDIAAGKPVKPTPELFGTLGFCDDDALPPVFPRFAFPEAVSGAAKDFSAMDMEFVRPTDIDMNGHVNNLNYARWILAHTPESVCVDRMIRTLDTHFIAEARPGDRLACRTAVVSGDTGDVEYVHSIVRLPDREELFRARTVWQEAGLLCRPLKVS
jgi:acyl-ACP thioesterase